MKTILASSYALGIGVVAALLVGCRTSQLPATISPSAATPFAFTHHMTFRYTGKKQTFNVPSGVTRIRVIAVGASGGGSVVAHGGRVTAVIPVTPSERLAVYVGGAGTSSTGGFDGGGAGGRTCYSSNGCGYSGYGAGGASDVREGGDALTDRVIVAGGGGGGGGGGFYGGGGGGAGILDFSIGIGSGGGGGGGSSYVESTASDVHMWQGWKDAIGNGLVVLRWQ
jgi:hypothetical protein